MDTRRLEEIIERHEGYRQYAYKDSLGYVTVGIGRCLDKAKGEGISREEAIYLLRNNINECQRSLESYQWYKLQDDVRKGALIELTFNMGIGGLLRFKKMLQALLVKDYKQAKDELLDSLWAHQVQKSRVDSITRRIELGEY